MILLTFREGPPVVACGGVKEGNRTLPGRRQPLPRLSQGAVPCDKYHLRSEAP